MGFGNTAPALSGDAGSIVGTSFTWNANNNSKGIVYPGRSNTPNGRAISVIMRIKTGYNGSSATQQGFWSLISGAGKLSNLEMAHTTAGNIIVQAKNEAAALCMNNAIAGSWSATNADYTDLTLAWNGTNTGSSCVIFANTSVVGYITPTAAFTASWTDQYFSEIVLAQGNIGSTLNGARVEEFAILDYVVDVNNAPLVGGPGPLSGPARTALIDAIAFDGSVYTNPGIANVKTGETYVFAGSTYVGTLAAGGGGGGSFPFVGG